MTRETLIAWNLTRNALALGDDTLGWVGGNGNGPGLSRDDDPCGHCVNVNYNNNLLTRI